MSWSAMRSWGPTANRFDHQPLPVGPHLDRRVMYAAPQSDGICLTAQSVLRTCLAEVFRDRGVIDLAMDAPYFVLFELDSPVTVLDVADGPWITEAGGNAAISSGPRDVAREWARAIYDAYPQVAGIIYTCSNIPSARSLVLWERAEQCLPANPTFNRPLSDASLRADIEVDAKFLRLELWS